MTDTEPTRPDTSDMMAVHRVFRSSLASGPAFVTSAAGDDLRRAMVANYYANLMAFLEVHHDGEEKLVFPLLSERATGHRAAVDKAAAQHAEVVGTMEAVNDSLGGWEGGGDPDAPHVVRSLQALDSVLSPHLDEEEAEIVPRAAEHLTIEEWGILPGHAMGNFAGDKVWLILGLIRENFTPAQRDAMLRNMPPPGRAMWETTGEAAFTDLIGRVRQTG